MRVWLTAVTAQLFLKHGIGPCVETKCEVLSSVSKQDREVLSQTNVL